MVHVIIELEGFILTLGSFIQDFAGLRSRDFIRCAMSSEERNGDLFKIFLEKGTHSGKLTHGSHAGFPSIYSGIAGNDLELLRILDGFLHHFVVWHDCPCVSQAEEQPIGSEAPPRGFHGLRHDEQRGREHQSVPPIWVLKIH
eukprot:Gb_35704 [translate_table: standard]